MMEILKVKRPFSLRPLFRLYWHDTDKWYFDLVILGDVLQVVYGRAGLCLWTDKHMFFRDKDGKWSYDYGSD